MRKNSLLIGLIAFTLFLAGCGGSSNDYYEPYSYDPGIYDPGTYVPDLPVLIPDPNVPNPNPNPNPNPGTPTWTLLAYYDNYETPAGEILYVTDSWDGLYQNDSYRVGETLVELRSRTTQQGGYLRYWRPANGTFEYEPPSATFTGTDQFTYTLSDESGRSSTATVYIDVY